MSGSRSEWKRLRSGERTVEARIIHPAHDSGDLVLFCPGYPGGGATIYEQRHSERLTEESYTQIILRHNGTRVDGPQSAFMLNTKQFPTSQPYTHSGVLGGQAVTVRDWLSEPQTVLEDIGCQYTNIYILAHSFGSVTALTSLANLFDAGHPVCDRIRVCRLLAPALGTLDGAEDQNIMRIWKDGFFDPHMIAERIEFSKDQDLAALMREFYRDLPERVALLPKSLQMTFLHVEKDEYIHEKDVRDFCKACGREADMMIDQFDHPVPNHGLEAHDMPVYPTELLLQLIEPDTGLIDLQDLSKP